MLGALTLRSWPRLATERSILGDRFSAIDADPVRLK
jgi:hypothetical protein